MKITTRRSNDQGDRCGAGDGGDDNGKIISALSVTSLCESGTRTTTSSSRTSTARHGVCRASANGRGIVSMSSSSNSTLTSTSSASSGFGLPVSAGASKATLSLYHVTFLTFMVVTLLFFIITIGASESEFGLDSLDDTTTTNTSNNKNVTVSQTNQSSSISNSHIKFINVSTPPDSVKVNDSGGGGSDEGDESSLLSEEKDKINVLSVHSASNDGQPIKLIKNVSSSSSSSSPSSSVSEGETGPAPIAVSASEVSNAQAIFNSISQSILEEQRRKRERERESNSVMTNFTANKINPGVTEVEGAKKYKFPNSVHLSHSSSSSSSSSEEDDSRTTVTTILSLNPPPLPPAKISSVHEAGVVVGETTSSPLKKEGEEEGGHSRNGKSDQNQSTNGFSEDSSKYNEQISSSLSLQETSSSAAAASPIITNGGDIKLSLEKEGNGGGGGGQQEEKKKKKAFNFDNDPSSSSSSFDHYQADQPSSSPKEEYNEDWTSRVLRSFGFGRFLDSISQPHNQTTTTTTTFWPDGRRYEKGGGTSSSSSTTKQRGSRSVCRISEFSCSRGKCVASDKYCNGIVDCPDSSDEPPHCTPCNRTYYGEWGSTYSLSLSSETISSILQSGSQAGRNSLGGGGDKKPATVPHFVCQLAFAAAGDNFGDLVQIMFDSINIGQFSSSMVRGCPTGSLQIFEINRPITGGHWCGSGSGYSVYFSEMSAIVLTLSLGDNWLPPSTGGGGGGGGSGGHGGFNKTMGGSKGGGGSSANDTVHNFSKWTSKGGDTAVITSSQQQQNHFEFDFKIRYKFIPRSLAVVRYGLLNSPIERGALVPNTYCSRVLDTCHKTRCKIQSPNYPGLYPRNLTCYYTVRQREIPPCKRVLIQVTQMKPHKVQLRSIPGRQLSGGYSMEQSTNVDAFLAWEDCRGDRDSLIIYDGTSTNDPVLLKLCGGSYIPPITSSGPAILVAFHSTAFGNPLDPKPAAPFPSPLRGFELDVGVVIVDSESADYNNHHNCSFIFISSKTGEGSDFQAQEYGGNWITGKSGIVSSPRHTVPLNTTCRYEFRGNKHEAIWIYFVAYRRDLIKDSKEYEGNCTTRLRIWDGIDTRNNALLATYCDNELPRLCDHKALENETRLVRACTANESYISAGSKLIIEQQFMEGTALRPLHYQFNYEFVSRHAGTEGTCHRHYNLAKMKSHRGIIRTSDNVFDFGRGGRANLTCTYTFTLPSYESLHIRILNSSFGERPCRTLTDFETGRYVCNETASSSSSSSSSSFSSSDSSGPSSSSSSSSGSGVPRVTASLRIHEEIWTNLNITSHENCLCGNSSNNPLYVFTFLGRKVHLKFTIENMQSMDSYENFFVFFEYELKPTGCRGDNHYMRTESGMISLESSFSHGLKEKPPTCEHYPWIIEAREGYSLYLRVPGFAMIEPTNTNTMHSGGGFGGDILNNNININTASGHKRGFNGTMGNFMGMNHSMSSSSSSSSNEYQPSAPILTFENRLCPTTKNRIFIYDRSNKLIHKICPASNLQQMQKKKTGQIVEIYSKDFDQFNSPLYPPLPPKFIIEFIGRELGSYRIQWLEVMSAKTKLALLNMGKKGGGEGGGSEKGGFFDTFKTATTNNNINITSSFTNWIETKMETMDGLVASHDGRQMLNANGQSLICPSFCPELNACISPKLWCDGEVHCPVSLSDEKSCDSFWLTISQLMSPAVYIPVAAAIVSALVCCGLVMLCLFLKRTVLNGHVAKDDGGVMSHHHSLERRLQRLDPHDPVS